MIIDQGYSAIWGAQLGGTYFAKSKNKVYDPQQSFSLDNRVLFAQFRYPSKKQARYGKPRFALGGVHVGPKPKETETVFFLKLLVSLFVFQCFLFVFAFAGGGVRVGQQHFELRWSDQSALRVKVGIASPSKLTWRKKKYEYKENYQNTKTKTNNT